MRERTMRTRSGNAGSAGGAVRRSRQKERSKTAATRRRTPAPAVEAMPPPQISGAVLREQRRRLNLTLEEVARRIGVTKGFLSEVERDRAAPSVATLMRLREALNLSVASLFTSSQPRLVRAKERQEIFLGGTDIGYSLLSGRDSHRVTVVWGRLEPGATSGSDMHTLSADEELIFVLSGTFEITLDGTTHLLRVGDAFTFDPRRPHRYTNPSKKAPVVAICVIAPPPRDRSQESGSEIP
jgi:transcriptional regulator with XRE-family HTH domain